MFGPNGILFLCIIGFVLVFISLIDIITRRLWMNFKNSKLTLSGLLVGLVLIANTFICAAFGWAEAEDVAEYTTSYDIISLSSDDNYQMNLSGTTAFSIGYISGSANKRAEYVVFENHNEKGYIRKEYNANRTFVKFDSNDTPHVTVTHIKSIKKAKFRLLADDVKDEWNETTIVVPDNAHQLKFNVE